MYNLTMKVRLWWDGLKARIWSRLVKLAEIAGAEAARVAAAQIENVGRQVSDTINEAFRRDPVASTSNYVAGTVTLTNASQAYNILQLIKAQVDANCPGAARAFNLYAAHANGALVYIGGPTVSSTNYAYVLNADDMRGYDSTYQNVIVGNIFAFSTSPSMKLGVEVMAM